MTRAGGARSHSGLAGHVSARPSTTRGSPLARVDDNIKIDRRRRLGGAVPVHSPLSLVLPPPCSPTLLWWALLHRLEKLMTHAGPKPGE